ncbi:MAG: patatin family protein [Oscillospiraceae bacterium]|nr:patatin family protein [Oscillospiraceae bacterium]
MKTGLVLEGGAMRGMFTCGVLDVFMERGLVFDGAAGISAGAVFGCNYKSRQPGRALRYNLRYCRDPRYCSLRSLLKTGDLYGAAFCYDELPNRLDVFDRAAFQSNPMAFYIGATDVRTGEAVYHRCEDGGARDLTWMRASASMPLVSRPVEVDGHTLLDGGIVDAVPYRCMERNGYERNVIVLTQPAGFVKQPAKGLALMRRGLRRYPKVAEAMAVRHERYNRQMQEIAAREADGRAFVIRPPEALGISRTERDPKELQRVYDVGKATALRVLDDVLRFLHPGGETAQHA